MTCPKCNGHGLIYVQVESNGRKQAYECECQKALNLRKRMEAACIPSEFCDPGLGFTPDLLTTSGVGENIRPLDLPLFTKNLGRKLEDNLKRRVLLVFQGPNGTGKTLAATKILIEALARGRRGYYIVFDKYLRLAWGQDPYSSPSLEDLHRCDVLVVDELGKKGIRDSIEGEVETLVRQRSSRDGITILISNFDDVGLADGQSAHRSSIDSLLRRAVRVNFVVEDFRRRQDPEQVINAIMEGV